MIFDLGHRARKFAAGFACITVAVAAAVSLACSPAAAWNGRHVHGAPVDRGYGLPHLVASASAPVAIGVKLVQASGRATLAFDMSAPAASHAFVLANPKRVIVDLSEVNFQIDPGIGRSVGGDRRKLVAAYRFGLFAPGRSRIVIDLNGPAKIAVVNGGQRIGQGPAVRLSVELTGTDAETFERAAAEGARIEAAAPQPAGPSAGALVRDVGARRIILLDPGHGGIDPGATGVDGAVEKDIVLAYARILATKLEGTGRYKVVMTRTGDEFVSLADRLKLAREVHAALLVSIHCDTLAASPQVAGTTIYTVSDRASDAEAARIAEKENRADLAGGVDAKGDNVSDVADILFDFTRRETRTYAHVFARTLVNYLKTVTKLNYNPQRSAGFWVLKAPDVPSVLIELGYLSSRADVTMLTSAEWREKTSASFVGAIDRVFVSGPGAGPKTDAGPTTGQAPVAAAQHRVRNAGTAFAAGAGAMADAPH